MIKDYSFIPLETTDEALLGDVDIVEICKERIYILDLYRTGTLYVFDLKGKLIQKFTNRGNGPGEFMSPSSFWIEGDDYIYVLDWQLRRLLKYKLKNLEFYSEIRLPGLTPLSFIGYPGGEQFLYYYPPHAGDPFYNKQYIKADRKGNINLTLFDAPPSGKILYQSPENFYVFNGKIRTVPFFSDKIYELNNDTLVCCYSLAWGNLKFPPTDFFQNNDFQYQWRRLFKESNGWIRQLYTYETSQYLVVKYWIDEYLNLSMWNKETGQVMNARLDQINDDLGLGGTFPLPKATHGDQFIGLIKPEEIDKSKVTDLRLKEILKDTPEESNPILVLYHLK